MDNKSSIFESPTNCNDDQSIYLQPLSSLITNDSSYHTEEQSCKAFPSVSNFDCIADQTSCDSCLALEEDDSEDSEDAMHDRSSYLHTYSTLFKKTSFSHIYKMCQN